MVSGPANGAPPPPFGKWVEMGETTKYRQFKLPLSLDGKRMGEALIQQWNNETWVFIMPQIVIDGFEERGEAERYIIKLTIALSNKIKKVYGYDLELVNQSRSPEVGQPGHPATYSDSSKLHIIDPNGEIWYIDGSPDPRRELEVRGWRSIEKTLYTAHTAYQFGKLQDRNEKVDTLLGIVVDQLFKGEKPEEKPEDKKKGEPEGHAYG